MIAEQSTSQHCLHLRLEEIGTMLKMGCCRDQDTLRNIYQRMELKKCQLVRMENENGAQQLFAKKIEEEEQNH
jgi:hypothetical protein